MLPFSLQEVSLPGASVGAGLPFRVSEASAQQPASFSVPFRVKQDRGSSFAHVDPNFDLSITYVNRPRDDGNGERTFIGAMVFNDIEYMSSRSGAMGRYEVSMVSLDRMGDLVQKAGPGANAARLLARFGTIGVVREFLGDTSESHLARTHDRGTHMVSVGVYGVQQTFQVIEDELHSGIGPGMKVFLRIRVGATNRAYLTNEEAPQNDAADASRLVAIVVRPEWGQHQSLSSLSTPHAIKTYMGRRRLANCRVMLL